MTLSTLVSDSSNKNFDNIRKAIIKECDLSQKYSLLKQTTYFYEEGQEKTSDLVKADIHDRIVVLKVDGVVSTTTPVLDKNDWASQVKYSEGAKWEPASGMKWYSTTRYPEKPAVISQATFYSKFWFSSSQTIPQLNQFGRDIVKYDQASDSFKTKVLSTWDGHLAVNSSVVSVGCVLDLNHAIDMAKIQAQSRYPSAVIPDDILLVFTDTESNKYVLIGAEIYRAWNSDGNYMIGFRGVFQAITNTEFTTNQVVL